jgi:hypothetical protein
LGHRLCFADNLDLLVLAQESPQADPHDFVIIHQ